MWWIVGCGRCSKVFAVPQRAWQTPLLCPYCGGILTVDAPDRVAATIQVTQPP